MCSDQERDTQIEDITLHRVGHSSSRVFTQKTQAWYESGDSRRNHATGRNRAPIGLLQKTIGASDFSGFQSLALKRCNSASQAPFPATCSRVIRAMRSPRATWSKSVGLARANKSSARAITPVHPV